MEAITELSSNKVKTDINNVIKVREKLTNEQINDLIKSAGEKIKNKIESLILFTNDLQPQECKEFRQILKSISFQYFCLNKYNVKLADLKQLRLSNASVLISVNVIDVYHPILNQLFHEVFGKNYSEEVNDNLYDSIKNIITVCFNYTDASSNFGKEFCKRDKILNLYHKIIEEFKEKCLAMSLSKSIKNILRICMTTLYNTLIHDVPENLIKMRAMKFLDNIKDFMNCTDEKIKRTSLLFTAYVADENESKLLKSDPESISYLIDLLKQSMNTRYERSQGLSTEELSKGLEKLSKNDENKRLLVEVGILSVIKMLLAKDDVKYKKTALSILWSLAFDPQNKITINEEFSAIISEMKSELKRSDDHTVVATGPFGPPPLNDKCKKSELKGQKNSEIVSHNNESENKMTNDKENCRKALDGLVWTLTEFEETNKLEEKKKKEKKQESPKEKHIMISYNWSNSDIAMKICDSLIDKGYKIWIDKYNITETENLMESMAQAVQNSFAVLICVSFTYKDSPTCRAEAQYAVSQKKPIIAVMVQEKYRPDGWLGFCIAGLQYCDFFGRYKFEEALTLLIKQLNRIKIGKEIQKPDEIDKTDSKNNVTNKSNLHDWSNEKVNEWFQKIGIKKIVWKSHYTGSELYFLRTVSQVPGEGFYQICKTELEISDLRDLRILFENLQLL